MAISINGNNNGIAVDGDLSVNHIDFTPGQGLKSASGFQQKEKTVYTECKEESESKAYSECKEGSQSKAYSECKEESQSKAYSECKEESQSKAYSECKEGTQSKAYSECKEESQSKAYSECKEESQSKAYSEYKEESQSKAHSECKEESQSKAHSECKKGSECSEILEEEACDQSLSQLTNRQIVIMMSGILDISLSKDFTNQKQLAIFLSRLTGRSMQSIRQVIMNLANNGSDTAQAHKDYRIAADTLEPINKKIASRLRNDAEE